MKRLGWVGVVTALLLASPVVVLDATAQADTPRQQTLVLGRVSQDPVKTLPRLRAMADYLASRMGDVGIVAGDGIVVRTNAEMVELLRSGAVDMVSETTMSAFHFAEAAGAELLLREWKRGVSQYEAILIVRGDSGVRSIADLRDRVVAFEDPGSTSGFLMPLALLGAEGIDAVQLASPGERPPPGCVGYVFTNGEINIAAWVARGITDAGALSNLDWQDEARTPETLRGELAVFLSSPPIPRSVALVPAGLRPEVRSALRRILLQMGDDDGAAEVLETYYGVSRYDAFEGQSAADLAAVRQHYEAIRDRLR